MIEIHLNASTDSGRNLWARSSEYRLHWFHPLELSALASRRNKAAATTSRMMAKSAIRRVLRRAGMKDVPKPSKCVIAVEPNGRPWVDLPSETVEWLTKAGLGLDISLSHTHDRAFAVAVIA